MAIVKILYDEDAKGMETYLKLKRDIEGPTTEHLCLLDGMASEFKSLQHDRASKGNASIHLIQSWSSDESRKLNPTEIHSMGLELVNRFAPGHQYIVQTHTEEAHSHNHIVINPVSLETGARIQNKLAHIRTLRAINDEIALSRGLTVLPPQEKLRQQGPNEISRRIDAYRGRSYILDLASKADFSRHHARNYDEYIAFLNTFDIEVRLEPKNITYYYPGRQHGKRGRNLCPELDKPGLESRFQRNQERFQTSIESTRNISDLAATYNEFRADYTESKVSKNPALQKMLHRSRSITIPDKKALVESTVPVEELRKAKTQSILNYCQREKIKLDRTKEGSFVLQGRDHIEVSDFTWINHKNKTRGNIIDFAANHHQVGFLQAVSILNDNPNLLLLEKDLGEVKKSYQAFYIPHENVAPRTEAIAHLSRLLELPTSHPVHTSLFKRQQVHVTQRGSIFFLVEGGTEKSGMTEYELDPKGAYFLKNQKSSGIPFFSSMRHHSKNARELRLYSDPKTFLKFEPESFVHGLQAPAFVVALFTPDLAQIQRVLAQAPKLRKIQLFIPHQEGGNPAIQKFYTELMDLFNPFSIETQLAWEPMPGISIERESIMNSGLERSREIRHSPPGMNGEINL